MIIDFKSLQNDQDIKCDICIVGAGAAGSILFDKLSDSKFNIVLLESGLVDIDENYQELNSDLLKGLIVSYLNFQRNLKTWVIKELLLILRFQKKLELHLSMVQTLNILKSIHRQVKNN